MRASIARVGFACVTYALGLSTNHGFRLENLTKFRLEETVNRNLDDLEAILKWMHEKGLRLFRIGSSLIPFASHPKLQFDWKQMCSGRLRQIGETYSSLGFRFSMHPGQYNVLNSLRAEVARQAIAELNYSCDVLDLMGLDSSHKVIVHGGGVYSDKEGSLERLAAVLAGLPHNIRRRLALENDERNYSFGDIWTISSRTRIPAIFDWQHHQLNPSENIQRWLREVPEYWDSTPKVHISSQKPNARAGAHDDFVHPNDMEALLEVLPFDADLMVEAKAKEAAAIEVLKWLEQRRLTGK